MWSLSPAYIIVRIIVYLALIFVYSTIVGWLALKLMRLSASEFTSFGMGLVGYLVIVLCIFLLDDQYSLYGWPDMLFRLLFPLIVDIVILGIYKRITGRNTI